MSLRRDQYLGHTDDRRVCIFTMREGRRTVRFAVSWELLDALEATRDVKAAERATQFDRLRARIEQLAERRFGLLKPGANPQELVLTSVDLER